MTYHTLLKQARMTLGYSSRQVIADTGVSNLTRIENGKADAGFTTVVRLARYYGVSIYQLERGVRR